MQAYSDPNRANDPHALPDMEVFEQDGSAIFEIDGVTDICEECGANRNIADGFGSYRTLCLDCARQQYGSGWYWQSCSPGCLPDSDPVGPFATQAEALADAQQSND